MSEGGLNILLVWQDYLWDSNSNDQIDWVRTGSSITPRSLKDNFKEEVSWIAVLQKLLHRKYDLVLLPTVDFSWHADSSFIKKSFRRILYYLSKSKWLSDWFRHLFFSNQVVVVLDRQDKLDTCKEYRNLVGAEYTFKVNLTEAAKREENNIGLLPVWINTECYDISANYEEKDIDLFFCCEINSEARKQALNEVKVLKEKGYRVEIAKKRLDEVEYFKCLKKSLLVVSPEGYGYECFRHYESLLAGSFPLINKPMQAMESFLVEGVNFYKYDTSIGGLVARAIEVLENRKDIESKSASLIDYALTNHSRKKIGTYLIAELRRKSILG